METKKLGLDIQANLFKFFFDSEYLHYGYWTPGLEVKATNFRQAQENYARLLMEHIPPGTRSILEIGCGTGKMAEDLIRQGYEVTCVSPPGPLTDRAIKRLNGKGTVHAMRFEDFTTEEKFDLCLFSESYQYIDMRTSFAQCGKFLKPGGWILLCDFFRTEAEGTSPLGGGHRLTEFYDIQKQQPFEIVKDLDITDPIAPTMTLINNLTMDVVYPAILMVGELIKSRHPWVFRFLMWKFRKKIEKNRIKHFTGQRNPENFKKYKSYRLILLRKY
jgi:SAM-dependent methyltransferase